MFLKALACVHFIFIGVLVNLMFMDYRLVLPSAVYTFKITIPSFTYKHLATFFSYFVFFVGYILLTIKIISSIIMYKLHKKHHFVNSHLHNHINLLNEEYSLKNLTDLEELIFWFKDKWYNIEKENLNKIVTDLLPYNLEQRKNIAKQFEHTNLPEPIVNIIIDYTNVKNAPYMLYLRTKIEKNLVFGFKSDNWTWLGELSPANKRKVYTLLSNDELYTNHIRVFDVFSDIHVNDPFYKKLLKDFTYYLFKFRHEALLASEYVIENLLANFLYREVLEVEERQDFTDFVFMSVKSVVYGITQPFFLFCVYLSK